MKGKKTIIAAAVVVAALGALPLTLIEGPPTAVYCQEMGYESKLVKTDLPSHFDWRDNGGNWMTPVKTEGCCGSCWAFAVVGAVEAQFNIASGNPDLDLDLSEQYLVSDCCTYCGNCSGGWSENALVYIRDEGIPNEDCFPYTASNSLCSDRCADWSSRLNYIDEIGDVPSEIETIKEYLIEKGPLVAYMGRGSNYGSYWDNGIYRCTDDSGSNHAIVIVGYNEEQNYWIAKNSWGDNWNGDGYFNVGCGECSIESHVIYNIVAPFIIPTPTPTPKPQGCYWVFPWGINEDPTAAFGRYLTQNCVSPISLPTGGEPSGLMIVWHYDESVPGGEWIYWIPEFGGGLTQLESDLVYLIVVEDGDTWDLMPPN